MVTYLIVSTKNISALPLDPILKYFYVFVPIGSYINFAREWIISKEDISKNRFKRSYFLVLLSKIILTAFSICLNYQYKHLSSIYFSLIIEGILFVWTLKLGAY